MHKQTNKRMQNLKIRLKSFFDGMPTLQARVESIIQSPYYIYRQCKILGLYSLLTIFYRQCKILGLYSLLTVLTDSGRYWDCTVSLLY